MISMVLSTMLMSAAFMIYNSIGRTSKFIKRIADEDGREVLVIKRFKQDLVGFSAIWHVASDIKSVNQQEAAASSSEGMENKFFYSVNKNDSLDLLTFVTTSALPSYASNGPRFVRVVYKLDADPLNEGLYRLMRKEMKNVTDQIFDNELRSGAFSELASGVRSVSMSYYYFKQQEEGQVQAQGEEQAEPMNKLSEWNPENKDTQEITKGSTPYSIKVDMMFENKQGRQTSTSFRVDSVVNSSLKISSVQPSPPAADAPTAKGRGENETE